MGVIAPDATMPADSEATICSVATSSADTPPAITYARAPSGVNSTAPTPPETERGIVIVLVTAKVAVSTISRRPM